jgi:hypothetical protein
MRTGVLFFFFAAISLRVDGCGLDWTLPSTHYDSVEEHGYVAYWEKVGVVDLGGGLMIPINIGFNSHREASSSVLGKGWIVALLESHVEPVDENCMKVIMPDGWTFTFLRNGNTETWRGNVGWVGETNDNLFTIAAPCGWKIKFDQGKIAEIRSGANHTLTWRYNGGVPTEVDDGARVILQVDQDPATGAAGGLVIDGQRLAITMGRRPRVETVLGENLIAGLDSCVSGLQWADGRTESFAFGTDALLEPTLAIAQSGGAGREFTWNPETRQIKSDGDWTYQLQQVGGHLHFDRTSTNGKSESYEADDGRGVTTEKGPDGKEISTWRFPAGLLAGRIRRIVENDGGGEKLLYTASYFPSGNVMRETFWPDTEKTFADTRQLLKETVGGQVVYEQDFDAQGRLVHLFNPAQAIEMKRTYDAMGGQTTQVFHAGALFYTEQVDHNNRLVSIDEGEKP